MARTPARSSTRSLTPTSVAAGLVALVGTGTLLYSMFGRGGEAAREPVEVALSPAGLQRVQGVAIGRAGAPVVVYEFADFQCPACGLPEPPTSAELEQIGREEAGFPAAGGDSVATSAGA